MNYWIYILDPQLFKQFESNEEDYENALMEYEDRCRKLKKLGITSVNYQYTEN